MRTPGHADGPLRFRHSLAVFRPELLAIQNKEGQAILGTKGLGHTAQVYVDISGRRQNVHI